MFGVNECALPCSQVGAQGQNRLLLLSNIGLFLSQCRLAMFDIHLLLGDDVHALTNVRDELLDQRSGAFDFKLDRDFRFHDIAYVLTAGADITDRLAPKDKRSEQCSHSQTKQTFFQHDLSPICS